MADDKLIFPIRFDLEAGVKEALKDSGKALNRIEEALAKNPVIVKIRLDQQNRLSGQVQGESKKAASALSGLKKEMSELNRQWNALSARSRSGDIGARLMARYQELTQEAKGYTSTLGAAVKLEDRLAKQRERSANAASKAAQRTREYNNELKSQDSYISRLLKRMAVYASFSAFGNFLTNVREVTAQFELQRISLGAIIQDQQRANQLFSEIKAFALRSPIPVLDLTKYTKQLAAYKIETKDLFDTTKRLADVSVGLGVSMDRIILAYGQVKAASYLRAAEIRQFTEAGIPMLELLAEKFTELQGKTVSTAEVMEMVSKRMVDFGMVEQIFTDMTSAGGMFYNMQEVQGNTLYGMWQKLGDAASVMYDEIGNTEAVNSAMKTAIQLLTDLMKSWKQVGATAGAAVGSIFAVKVIHKGLKLYKTVKNQLNLERAQAAKEYNAASTAYNKAGIEEAKVRRTATEEEYRNVEAKLKNAAATWEVAQKTNRAAQSATVFGKALKSVGTFLKANVLGILATIISSVWTYLSHANDELDEFNSKMLEIESNIAEKNRTDIAKFKALADSITESLDGTNIQKKAIDELGRSYDGVIDKQMLTAENLRRLNGDYQEFYDLISVHNAEQKKAEKETATKEFYGKQIKDARTYILDEYKKQKDTVFAALQEFEELVYDGMESVDAATKINKRYKDILGVDIIDLHLILLYSRQADALDKLSNEYNKTLKEIQPYKEGIDELIKSLSELEYVQMDQSMLSDTTKADLKVNNYAKLRFEQNNRALLAVQEVKDMLREAGVEMSADLERSFFNIVDVFDSSTGEITAIYIDRLIDYARSINNSKLVDALKYLKENAIDAIMPTEASVAVAQKQFTEIADEISKRTGIAFDKFRYLLIGNEQDLKDYRKFLEDEVKNIRKTIKTLAYTKAQLGIVGKYDFFTEEQTKEAEARLEAATKMLNGMPIFSDENDRRGADPRLGILQEMVSTLKQINKEYDDLAKKEGATKALADTTGIYKDTFENMKALAKKYKFDLPEFEVPTDAASLTKYLDAIREAMKKLPKSEKAVLALQVDIDKLNLDDAQKKIDKQLKDLADRISRTKTAKEFYEKIISTTGDYSLASKVAESIFGQNGSELRKALAEQVRSMAGDIPLPDNIISADNVIEYKALRQFAEANKNELGKMYDELIKISNDGQKDLAKTYEGYLKDLEKAKTYADKRVELARTTAENIRTIDADIMAGNITEDVGKTIIRGLQKKESEEAAKLEYEAFKDTPLYVQMFEDLGQASSYALESMKEKLLGLQNVWGSALDPTQLKEIQSRINEIDAQLRVRNPFKTLRESYQQYHDALKNYTVPGAEGNVASAQASYDKAVKDTGSADSKEAKAAERTLDIEKQKLEIAKQLTDEKGKALKGPKALDEAARIANENEARARVELAQALADEEEAKANDDNVEAANEAVEAAKEKLNLAQATSEIIQNEAKTSKTLKESWLAAGQTIGNIGAGIKEVGQSISAMMEAFGSETEDIQFVDDISNAVGDIFAGVGDIIQSALSGDVVGIVTGAITAPLKIITGFANLFSAGKVRRANKEIKKQQGLLDQLEYTYGRLEKAADKLFGTDYIQNYNQQVANLEAQRLAYMKQAQAERSKGKKADQDQIKEYENQARDTYNQIKDMQDDLANHFTGTDRMSAARDFAQSWFEAKASFANTMNAIKSKYKDLIRNMIIEGAAARVIDSILGPMWDKMGELLSENPNDPLVAVEYLMQSMDGFYERANNGMEVLWEGLKARGYDMKELISDADSNLSGISRDIASASEESINGLAAGINTQNYYISHVPTISENVAAIRQLMERGTMSSIPESATAGWTDWQQQAMDNYNAIARNTAETVAECRRSAAACEAFAADIHRMIEFSGGKHRLNVKL